MKSTEVDKMVNIILKQVDNAEHSISTILNRLASKGVYVDEISVRGSMKARIKYKLIKTEPKDNDTKEIE